MSGEKTPPAGTAAKSGEHPLKVEMRKRLESFDEHTMPEFEKAIERLGLAANKDAPPPAREVTRRLGAYKITIRGVGPHHNHHPKDANRIANRLVNELRFGGHEIVETLFEDDDGLSPIAASDPPPAPDKQR